MDKAEIQDRAYAYLQRFYGFKEFRPGQLDIITECVSGRDTTVLMPTGGGKSLCYQIPAMMLDGFAIVVSPLIALMHDQVNALLANGIPAAEVNSGIDESINAEVMDQVFAGHIKILYMSPERLVADLPRLSTQLKVSLFAIDEAHCISQWGHDFRKVYTSLSVIKERYPDTPVMALTATADRLTRDDIVRQLKLKAPFNYIGSFDRPNISLTVIPAPAPNMRLNLIESLVKKYANDSGIVYCLSRKNTEKVCSSLMQRGIKAVCYHAGMGAQARNYAQQAFINGDVQVVCATVAFGMGIDKSNIRWVVHYNMPGNIESYYQEVGRSGRDGLQAEAVMFYSAADVIARKKFAEDSGQQSVVLEKIERMERFSQAKVCRRRILLSYFNEEMYHDCGNCDVCMNPPERIDGTILAQKAMSAILRTNCMIGISMTIDILRGSTKSDLTSKGYHTIKTYGVGRDLSLAEWIYYIQQMIQLGLIDMDYTNNHRLTVTPYGMEVLRGQRSIELTKYASHKLSPARGERKANKTAAAGLLDVLKQVRKLESKRSGMPAYLIFSDATLADMAQRAPTTREEFAAVSGVGEKKLERYWSLFVEAILKFKEGQLT